MPENRSDSKSRKKLGRGLSQVSHVFLSGVERQQPEAPEAEDVKLWLPDGSLISVTSGVGVRGKTLVASSLGLGLCERGRRVALVNADSAKPDILDLVAHIGRATNGRFPASDLDAGGLSAMDMEHDDPGSTVGLSSGPVDVLESAARQAQFVIVDTSPASRFGVRIWKSARLVIVITEANTEKMRASYATIKRVNAVSPTKRVGLVVNRVQGHEEAESCFRQVSGVCRRFLKINLRNYGYIIHSTRVNEAYQRAVPLIRAFPESRAAKCISSILGLIMMDESAIAKRRREVREEECALKGGK
jgi:flagellar biosynthesis protein FlhG